MQIKSLKIDDYLCLVDFEIRFQTVQGGSSTILIGENGTGKSTMIDAILEIFMSFDSPAIEKRIDYNYEIVYEYAQTTHTITKDAHRYRVVIGDQVYEKSYSAIRNLLKRYRIFPQRIIAFYSGANNKIANMINSNTIIINLVFPKCHYYSDFFVHFFVDSLLTYESKYPSYILIF